MFNPVWAGTIQDDSNDVEAEGAVIDFVFGEEKAGGLSHPGFFGEGDYIFGVGEVLVFAGFDFDENYCAICVGHNEVYFTASAAEVMVEEFEAFFLKERETMFFTPLAASCAVERCGFFFEKPCKHLFGLYRCMFAVPLGKFDGLSCSLAEVIEFRFSSLSATDGLYVDDVRRVDRKYTLDAFVIDDSADGEVFVDTTAFAGDNNA